VEAEPVVFRVVHEDAGLIERLRRVVSRVVGNAGPDHLREDIALAERGGAFLVVHCPTELEAERMRRLVARLRPALARRYTTHAIEDLT